MTPGLEPWLARVAVILASIVMVGIRAPHGHRSRGVRVAKSLKGTLEIVLLSLAWVSFFLPLFWVATPWLAFADYPLHPAPFAIGLLAYGLGLWLFHRTHADLGTNWSITLEMREQHQLITRGTYRLARHPMYTAFLIYSAGQALALPNWLAGPSYLVVMALLVALRLGPEERMLRAHFGPEYDAYAARTKRLIPGVW
jgi:protein-S-isoprenylcysteine O-methyltransferase Ste14